jgi:hypothetical protein
MSVMAGNIDANLLGVNENNFLDALGIKEDTIEEFADLLGLSDEATDNLREFINSLAKGTKEVQKSNRKRLTHQLYEADITSTQRQDFYNRTDLDT